MPRFFIDPDGGYFEAITDIATPAGHEAVDQRPSSGHTRQGGQWVAGSAAEVRGGVELWAIRAVLGVAGVAMVDGIIAALPNGPDKDRLKAKWEFGGLVEYDHPDTQSMIAALAVADPTFDFDAAWAAAEAEQRR